MLGGVLGVSAQGQEPGAPPGVRNNSNIVEKNRSSRNQLSKDEVYELFEKKEGRCPVCVVSHRAHCGTPESITRCYRRQQNQLPFQALSFQEMDEYARKIILGGKGKKKKKDASAAAKAISPLGNGEEIERDRVGERSSSHGQTFQFNHSSGNGNALNGTFSSDCDSSLLEEVIELMMCSTSTSTSSGRKRQRKGERGAKEEGLGASKKAARKKKGKAVMPSKDYGESERCKMKELKEQVVAKDGDDLLNTCNWIAHMAESPTSLLMDYLKKDVDISKFKSIMDGLRVLRLEKILQRRQGLRPATGRSLTLVPLHSVGREVMSMNQEDAYPHRESRVGEPYQAVVPELRTSTTEVSDSDREEPILIWPNPKLGCQLEHDPLKTKRVLSLLSDPVSYEWTNEECSLFKHALAKYGKNFTKICKFIKESAPHSKKTTKECVAFYYTVWKTKPR